MIESQIKKLYSKEKKYRICQWDILKELSFYIWLDGEVEQITLPYSIVLTQDCDLSEDFNNRTGSYKNQDKFLKTILICPWYLLEDFCNGTHLWEEYKMQIFTSWKPIEKLKRNEELKRFHYLKWGDNFPDLVIDFKHFYSVSREWIYKKYDSIYISSISELFRESLSQRFTNFLWRIWLPEL